MNEEHRSFFCAGRWKHARIFAIVHLVFEVVGFFMLIASGFFIYSGAMGPVLAVIGESLTVGVCCRGDRGKGVAIASVALNSIALIFAVVSLSVAYPWRFVTILTVKTIGLRRVNVTTDGSGRKLSSRTKAWD